MPQRRKLPERKRTVADPDRAVRNNRSPKLARQQAARQRKNARRKVSDFRRMAEVLKTEFDKGGISKTQFLVGLLGVVRKCDYENRVRLFSESETASLWRQLRELHSSPEDFRRLNDAVETLMDQLGTTEPVSDFAHVWAALHRKK